MIIRRRIIASVLAGVFLSSCDASSELSLNDIIARHADARGGVATLNAIENTLNIATVTEPTFEIIGRYVASTAPNMRIDVFYDGDRVFSEGIDDSGEWQWSGGVPAATPSSEAAIESGALSHGVIFNLYGLHALTKLGHKIELEGRELIDGVSYYALKITLDDGFETWRYINPATWKIDYSRDFRSFHPDVDPTRVWVQTKYDDFRPVDGVVAPFRWTTTNLDTGEIIQTGEIHRLNYNVSADELNFPRDAAVIAP